MEVLMETNVFEQSEEMVLQVRYGPATNRPHSAPQPLWQGSLPQGVKKIMTRAALERHQREWYAKWASNFALLTDEFLAQVFEHELNRVKRLTCDKWTGFKIVDWHYCKVGDDYLWVQEQDGGWTVELCYPDVDPDARILTIENMPVLCPDAPWAAGLALACYPNPPAGLVWHSYW
jgi:hypothetical protein